MNMMYKLIRDKIVPKLIKDSALTIDVCSLFHIAMIDGKMSFPI